MTAKMTRGASHMAWPSRLRRMPSRVRGREAPADARLRSRSRCALAFQLSECSSRFLHVTRDLCGELGRAREGDLVAQSLHERDLDLLAVQLPGVVEKISLEYPLSTTESRADTE